VWVLEVLRWTTNTSPLFFGVVVVVVIVAGV
jgi:hypothetical protein